MMLSVRLRGRYEKGQFLIITCVGICLTVLLLDFDMTVYAENDRNSLPGETELH